MRDECWLLSKFAAFGRSRTFRREATEAQRFELQRELKSFVSGQLIPEYLTAKHTLGDEQHVRNIQRITDWSCPHANILTSGCLRIGIAQKLLNLYLKYLWCIGHLPQEPPHFPVDAIILRQIPGQKAVLWTKLASIEQYQAIIDAARPIAARQNLSLAEWELINWRPMPAAASLTSSTGQIIEDDKP